MNPQDGVHRRFLGHEKLTEFFGHWPGFEDAEILFLQVARQGEKIADGPTLTLRLQAFEWGQEVETGRTVINHRCVVTLRFGDVDELHLAGISSQNAIHGLEAREEEGGFASRIIIHFSSARGLAGSFSCYNAEVVAVRPGEPVDADYH